MKVLITGGAGYLGAVLCEVLIGKGHHVTVIDNLMYHQMSLLHLCTHDNFNFVKGDVRDEGLMKPLIGEADVIIPLAAIVGASACDIDPALTTSVNLDSVRMINRLRSAEQLVVFPNTNSGYGTQSGDVYCTEETPLEPISLYGKTKAEAEVDVLETPNSITLRLATVFGLSPRLRLDLLVNHFTYLALTEGYIVIFEKRFKRNFIHIRDVADCFAYCIENAEHMVGKAYNLGLDEANISKEELALKIKEFIPNFYIHFSEIGSDPDKRNYIVSNQRLRDAGFEASRSLDYGISELLKGYDMISRGPFNNA